MIAVLLQGLYIGLLFSCSNVSSPRALGRAQAMQTQRIATRGSAACGCSEADLEVGGTSLTMACTTPHPVWQTDGHSHVPTCGLARHRLAGCIPAANRTAWDSLNAWASVRFDRVHQAAWRSETDEAMKESGRRNGNPRSASPIAARCLEIL